MYQSYEFTYAGKAASMYGMFVSDIAGKKHGDNPFGNKANIVETRLADRVTPIHHGVRYNDEPLTFTLIFGADHVMDRFEMQEIANWLTGYQQYQWLTIDQPDLNHVQFRCLIKSLTPISVRWLPLAFEAKIVCDCPYAYGYPFEKSYTLNGETPVRFYNDSTCRVRLKPDMVVELEAGCTSFSVRNETTGETMSNGGTAEAVQQHQRLTRNHKQDIFLKAVSVCGKRYWGSFRGRHSFLKCLHPPPTISKAKAPGLLPLALALFACHSAASAALLSARASSFSSSDGFRRSRSCPIW